MILKNNINGPLSLAGMDGTVLNNYRFEGCGIQVPYGLPDVPKNNQYVPYNPYSSPEMPRYDSTQNSVQYSNEPKEFIKATNDIGKAFVTGNEVVKTADSIECFRWLDSNYRNSGMFSSQEAMQNYINASPGNERTFTNIIQGKGYEWDWMSSQRKNPLNIGKRYYAGDVANRAGSDVSEISLFTGAEKEHQMKAYTSNNIPDLHNTPKDMTVVVTAEKADAVKNMGYTDVEVFETTDEVSKITQSRMNSIKNGKVYTKHNFGSTFRTLAKAGASSAAIGAVTEAIGSYELYKNGEITAAEYNNRVLSSGAQAGLNAAATAAVMTPVAAVLATAGVASTPITVVGSLFVSNAVDKIIAPVFKKGDYKDAVECVNHMQDTVIQPVKRMVFSTLNSIQLNNEFENQFVLHIDNLRRNYIESERLYNESLDILKHLRGSIS